MDQSKNMTSDKTDGHYWKSVWNDNGQFICKVCGLPPDFKHRITPNLRILLSL